MEKPLCIDLFCGLGGWTEGFLAEGYRVVGFDIERHQYGDQKYPGQLVIQDVMTIHGSQFKDAAIIVASPPCQSYSYLAMPWSRSVDIVRPCGDGWEVLNSATAKEMREEWEREGPDNRLFEACFRIQMEAIEATRKMCPQCREFSYASCGLCHGAGSVTRYIPLIVENVRGAETWVGGAQWRYRSYFLWGDVPAIMPHSLDDGIKGSRGGWFGDYKSRADKGAMTVKLSMTSSKSAERKEASAQIAKIPLALSGYIARVYKPKVMA